MACRVRAHTRLGRAQPIVFGFGYQREKCCAQSQPARPDRILHRVLIRRQLLFMNSTRIIRDKALTLSIRFIFSASDGKESIESRPHFCVSKFWISVAVVIFFSSFFLLLLIDDDIVILVHTKFVFYFFYSPCFACVVFFVLFLAWKYFAWSLIICDFDYSRDSNCSLCYIKIDLFISLHLWRNDRFIFSPIRCV